MTYAVRRIWAVVAGLWLLMLPVALAAQDVTLQSIDGSVTISGTLLGFDGAVFRLDTRYGELSVDAGGVTCTGPGCPLLTDFVAELSIVGSDDMAQRLMPALIESFALRNGFALRREALPDGAQIFALRRSDDGVLVGRFRLMPSTTAQGLAQLAETEADLIMARRPIRTSEAEALIAAGLDDLRADPRGRVIALDALVPVVAPRNPVTALSMTDLRAILTGEITTWAELGGPDAPIALHLPRTGTALADAIADKVLTARIPTEAQSADTAARTTRHPGGAEIESAVLRDPLSLGVMWFSTIRRSRALAVAGPCGFVQYATDRTIKTEDYPLTVPLMLYLATPRLPKLGRDFIIFARGRSAQLVVQRTGYVDQTAEDLPLNQQGERLANAIAVAEGADGLDRMQQMVARLRGMSRLTTSFRFEPGVTRLDAQSRANVRALAAELQAGQYDGRELLFAGFSDGQGREELNRAIARQRAEGVRAAVLATVDDMAPERVEITVEGFGEAMPMACDEVTWGRNVNRRVEVWVR